MTKKQVEKILKYGDEPELARFAMEAMAELAIDRLGPCVPTCSCGRCALLAEWEKPE